MKQQQQRICIYSSDVILITGKGERAARKIMQTVRESVGKEDHQPLTVCEISQYLGLDPLVVYKTINNLPLLEDWSTKVEVSSENPPAPL